MTTRLLRARPLGVILAAALLTTACGGPGPDGPPEAFGAVATTWFGCPSMQGQYEWPPVAGHVDRPWNGMTPVPVEPRPMQFWVQQRDNGRITLRTRRINRDARVRDTLAREWSHAEYTNSEYDCKGGVLQFRGIVGDFEAGKGKPPPKSQPLFRLARLQDQGLAIAVASGPPDNPRWRWSKLAYRGPGDQEPAPEDASQ